MTLNIRKSLDRGECSDFVHEKCASQCGKWPNGTCDDRSKLLFIYRTLPVSVVKRLQMKTKSSLQF